jgi:hypothetical protein
MSDSDSQNTETVVKCPIDGCSHEGLSRGIHLHIRQSSGNGHGPNGEVPEHLDLSDLEVVGEKTVDVDYPEERDVEEVVRLCPYCGRAFNGFHGIKIHLGQKQGQGVHPDNIDDISKEDCPVAHVDDDMNVIEIVEENELMPSTKRRILDEDTVLVTEVEEFIESLEDEGESEFADRVRNELL